ncbi:MAG: MBL fold metallo-hydrolase [Candidatus Aquicultor sp.]|nr:MBL fold metallo-hydrolase [Candidatus Aquicultor sp.]
MLGRVKISWLGHASFKIETSAGMVIVTDPYSEKTGYVLPYVEADIVTISHHHYDHDNVGAVGGSPQVVEAGGKIVIGSTTIEGIDSFHDEVSGDKRGRNIIFKFYVDGLVIAHMGDYGQSMTREQRDALGDVDVLLIPVGGTFTIDHAQAAEIVRELKPKIAVPMHYKTELSTINIGPVGPFLESMTVVREQGVTIELSADELPAETEVWVMEYLQA